LAERASSLETRLDDAALLAIETAASHTAEVGALKTGLRTCEEGASALATARQWHRSEALGAAKTEAEATAEGALCDSNSDKARALAACEATLTAATSAACDSASADLLAAAQREDLAALRDPLGAADTTAAAGRLGLEERLAADKKPETADEELEACARALRVNFNARAGATGCEACDGQTPSEASEAAEAAAVAPNEAEAAAAECHRSARAGEAQISALKAAMAAAALASSAAVAELRAELGLCARSCNLHAPHLHPHWHPNPLNEGGDLAGEGHRQGPGQEETATSAVLRVRLASAVKAEKDFAKKAKAAKRDLRRKKVTIVGGADRSNDRSRPLSMALSAVARIFAPKRLMPVASAAPGPGEELT
jgi:hypothetical protein